jgi:hypothetical protein
MGASFSLVSVSEHILVLDMRQREKIGIIEILGGGSFFFLKYGVIEDF